MTLQTNQPITSQELADSVRYGVAEQDRILRKKEVAKIFSVSSSTLDDWLNPKSKRYKADFPKRIEIGRKPNYKAVHCIISENCRLQHRKENS